MYSQDIACGEIWWLDAAPEMSREVGDPGHPPEGGKRLSLVGMVLRGV